MTNQNIVSKIVSATKMSIIKMSISQLDAQAMFDVLTAAKDQLLAEVEHDQYLNHIDLALWKLQKISAIEDKLLHVERKLYEVSEFVEV